RLSSQYSVRPAAVHDNAAMLLEHRVARAEPQQHAPSRPIHLGMYNTMLAGCGCVSHDSVERIAAIDGAGSREVIHVRNDLLRCPMHIDEHDSIERPLA